ncbi:hypothetical protein SAMN05445756_0926 [Kytococcus aerolatus]|uniref:Na+/glutamate symporter n=1 Tax=Kytococcus aerolatus TaxID=592308 RepID=A0A212TBX2_9MICO|nr:hypothetical protein [Kytococcus aerolatus]SNC63538.1 hypothetical protein SAMN05445756_0926 [Kytococcus aerolatus]
MEPVFAAVAVLGAIALGEIVSIATRARVPSMLVALLAMVVAVQLGWFPAKVVESSGFVAMSAILTPAIMVHMGTLLPMSVLRANWKSVVITAGAMLGACLMILPIVSQFFGYGTAVAGAGPVAGGIVSTLLTVEGLQSAGFDKLATIPPLVMMLQFLPAMPLTNWLLKRYAADLVGPDGKLAQGGPAPAAVDFNTVDDSRLKLPEQVVQSQTVLFFLLVGLGSLGWWLGELSGVSYSLWGLGLGVLLAALGFLPQRAMERANAFTPAMVGVIATVMAPLALASLDEIINALAAVTTILVIGLLGIVVGGFITSKLVGWDPRLGVPVALTAMLGFPADYIISQEVARSASPDEKEQEAVLGHLLPPMLVGGFASVSAGSIVIASVLVSTL